MKHVVLLVLLAACETKPSPYVWNLPPSIPPPIVPTDNPMSNEKVALGRYLFYDVRLSGNGTMSCSSCHQQSLAFTDGKVTPIGSTGSTLPRNAMSIVNAAYNEHENWANPLLTTLEEQMAVPMFNDSPVELGMSEKIDDIIARLRADQTYVDLFGNAFPFEHDAFTIANIVSAIACFERTIIAMDAPYDRYEAGDTSAMSDSAVRGMTAFFQEKLDCYHCHAVPNFASNFISANTGSSGLEFRNDAIYNVGNTGAYPPNNPGLYTYTHFATDEGKFRPPTLRNIMLTAPYFHDGSAATIDDAIDNYVAGGRTITSGPYAGVGADNPNRDPLVKMFSFSESERADLHAFFDALTDSSVLTNPAFADPSAP